MISDAEINIKISSCLGFVCWFLKRKVLYQFSLPIIFTHIQLYKFKTEEGKKDKTKPKEIQATTVYTGVEMINLSLEK